ncbi:hypothetical protein KAU15_02335, partial [candidate division WOR-3 bacterium]|nr:hypothetical protein [candidate division WOR-3 bacterium]
MKKSFFIIMIGILCLIINASNINDAYFKGEFDKTKNNSIEKMNEIINGIEDISFPQGLIGLMIFENECNDGINRPYALYVPKKYNNKNKHTLIIYLHGGVGRSEVLSDEEIKEFVNGNEFKKLADKENHIVLFPMANNQSMWWDSIGTDNIFDQILWTKTHYNINDNAVFITGFSDGASGAFYFAMCSPTIFAGIIPLNGHAGVANSDGHIQTYFQNLYNRPLHVINTDEDRLYPDKKMREMMRLAIEAGGNITYRIYIGIGHSFLYAGEEMPIIEGFINNTRRNNFSNKLIWYTDNDKTRNRIDWLEITEIEKDEDKIIPNDDIEDYNMKLADDRITFGFYPDYEYEGIGVKIDKIAGDSTFCGQTGMLANDIFIKLDTFDIKTMDDMNKYKSTKQRGDSTEIIIIRDADTLTLQGAFPPIQYFPLFTRNNATAFVDAS